MSPTKTKFCFSTSRTLLISTTVFIMLSVTLAATQPRRCYWCGPLAEQVHRSRRAAPCGVLDDQATVTCEPGYNHCAIVLTLPPHVESRYCVKVFQDECYPLFCNATQTWKMTCTCRGDLCNGFNTEREIQSFVFLSKIVALTQKTNKSRIVKRTGQTNLSDIGYNNITRWNNESQVLMLHNSTQNENDIDETNDIQSTVTEAPTSIANFEKDNLDIMQSDEPNDINESHQHDYNKQETMTSITVFEPTINNEDSLNEKDIHTTQETKNENVNIDVATTSFIKSQVPTSINTMKPSEELPTAEALLHEASPTEKISEIIHEKVNHDETTTERTTFNNTMSNTEANIDSTTGAPSKNNAVRINTHTYFYYTTIFCFVLLNM